VESVEWKNLVLKIPGDQVSQRQLSPSPDPETKAVLGVAGRGRDTQGERLPLHHQGLVADSDH
tara:strand:- start:3632 stop:3820 length:189 start_codon:yes stop_codon:yes gene_type:complete